MKHFLRLTAAVLLACVCGRAYAQGLPPLGVPTFGNVGVMIDQQFIAGSGVTPPVVITSGQFTGMAYFKLEFVPTNNSNITSCTVAVDSQVGSAGWVFGGAVPAASCASAGVTLAGPISANQVAVDISVQGQGSVRVRLSSALSSFATSGTGTITGVTAGTGLTGGGSSGAVTLALANQVTAGSCTACNLTYNAQGQITIAANGSGGGSVNISGTPTINQFAIWTNANTIQGVTGTGTGLPVSQTSPSLITPALGIATATTINGVTISATSGTLTIGNGKTLASNNTITFADGTDGTTQTFPGTSGTVVTSVTAAGGGLSGTYPNPTVNAINLAGSGAGGVTGTLPIGSGGTGQTSASTAIAALLPTATTAGSFPVWNGSSWTLCTGNTSGTQVLQESSLGVCSWGAGSATAFQVNGSGLINATTVNFQSSAAFNGLTATFTNGSLGNVTLGFSGSLGNAGLTNSSVTFNGTTVALGASGNISFQTAGTPNTSLAGLNLIASTSNSTGLANTPSNPGTNQVKTEITGTLNATSGGTGINTASSTGVAQINAGTWSISAALANGTTATTQTLGDSTTKVATDAFVIANALSNPLTTLGDTLAENSTPAPARIAGNVSTTMAVYTQTGTGAISALPAWTATVGGGASPVTATVSAPAQGQVLVYNPSGVLVNAYGGVNVDPQTGNYSLSCPTDRLGELDFDISTNATLTLPQAGSTVCLGSNIAFVVRNTASSTGVLTITATTSLFEPEAVSSHALLPSSGLFVYSDASSSTGNYHALEVPASFGGINTQTTSYTLTAADRNKMVVMNCSAPCAATMPAAAPNSGWSVWVASIGSTTATVSLNSLSFNGGATAPALISYMPLMFRTDGANYFGDAPLVAGTGITLTPAANGVTITSTASGGLSDPGGNGIVVRTALNTTVARGMGVGATGNLTITNPLGTGGNPTYDLVANILLGSSGTSGSVTMGNATSGTLLLSPPTGAMGTVTNTFQAVNDTFVYRASTDTLTNKSISENQLTGAAGGKTLTETAAGNSITRAGVETGNLTSPYVFTNTNSTNNNTSIGLGISTPGTSTGQTTLNVNGAATGGDLADFGTGGTWTAGVLSGQTILAKVAITGAVTAPSFTASGASAGNLALGQGSTVSAGTTNITIEAPASVTSYLVVLPGTAASGIVHWSNSSGTVTQSISAVSLSADVSGQLPIGSVGSSGLSGTAPVAISAAGAISITGAAGQVLAGAGPAFTATPTLGASGTLGSLAFGNATSGLLTLATATGAITSYTLQLPVAQPTGGNTFLSCTAANPAVCTWAAGGGAVTSVNTLTGAVVIEAATAGQMAVSGGNGAALTGAADMTYTTHTFATTTAGIFDWSAATGVNSLKMPPVVGGTSLAGTSTANLSAPIVIQNTNSSNNNTSITIGFSAPGTSTGQTVVNINGAATGGDLLDLGTGGTWTNGVLSGQTILAKVAITGAITAPSFTASGTIAGNLALGQGSTASTGTTNITFQAPTAVTSYLVTLPGTAAQGIMAGTLSGTTITEGFSGDSNHAAAVTIGSGTSIGLTSLCSTTFCPAGTYQIDFYEDITTACGTSGTYTVLLTWTDDQGSKSAFTVPNAGPGTAAGVLTTTTTANWGQAMMTIRSAGSAAIQYSTTAVACGTAGPMVGKLYMDVTTKQ